MKVKVFEKYGTERKTVELEEHISTCLKANDFSSGELESLRAQVRRINESFSKLLVTLFKKGIIISGDLRTIIDNLESDWEVKLPRFPLKTKRLQ